MSFPEWGHSYNALYVPLTSDWQCSLVPARDVEDVDRGWKLPYEERQKARKEREEQIEQDSKDFDQLFRVSISRRAARACSDFRAHIAFIRDHLHISGLSAPVDGEGVTRILRDAVRDGRLVPAINRAWRGSRRVTRRYGPQSWPKRAPDLKPTIYSFRNGQLEPLGADGGFIDRTPYVPVAARVAATVSKAAASKGASSWLGAVETAAAALIGASDNSDNEENSGGENDGTFSDNVREASTPLSDAQAFEYRDDAGTLGNDMQTAWLPSKGGPPNQWVENTSGKQQWRLYDGHGNAAVDIDFGHDHGFGIPHAHNWDNGVRDDGNAFSLLSH
ncbi:hypothetical protein [Paraburkholderia sp. JHI869]|uniref:hypothetical protein n=1 Tax=Paraburkholderia sp. JHI869 TaxID=3112959 RepID=UPI0031803E6E